MQQAIRASLPARGLTATTRRSNVPRLTRPTGIVAPRRIGGPPLRPVPLQPTFAASGAVPAGSGDEGKVVRPPPDDSTFLGMPHRWQVVAFMALAFILCNMDKVNMSVAVIPMAEELGWSATERGLVSSAFFWGYTLTQTPAGYLCSKIGGIKVLLAGVVLWSLGTAVAPPLAKMGILWLCASRFFVGLGEGLAPSSVTSVMANKVPQGERSRAVATVFGGLDVGSAVGLLLCGPLIRLYGWPIVFYTFAVLGLVWAALFPLIKPEAAIDSEEQKQAEIAEAAAAKSGPQKLPYGKFLTSLPVLAITVAHFCFNWGYYILLAWLPSYFDMALGLDVANSSVLTLIPYIAMAGMTPLVGPIADSLVNKGWGLTTVRKLAQGISFAGPAICMVFLAKLTPATPAAASPGLITLLVALMSLAFALSAWARAGLYCNHQDISPRYASALLGITNTAGALPGVLGVLLTGHLLDKTGGSFAQAIFYPAIGVQIFGLIFYTLFASSERQPWS
ncbi:unnamed protein product [Pedinophyceae sp. YPF-701]|nr:unnamed protein product [Pedinophyceae sp. YPF-701]